MIRGRIRSASPTLLALVMLALLMVPGVALARAHRDSEYPYDPVFASALRYLRVDRSFAVKDKDKEAGFILFVYRDGERRDTGSLEIVRLPEGSADGVVRLVVKIANQPSYIEVHLLDGLERKLKAELGDPPPRKSRKDGGS